MNAPAVLKEAHERLARAEAAVELAYAQHSEALLDDVTSWGQRYPKLCAAIRANGDIKGWLSVYTSRGECRLPMPEVLA